MGEVWEEKPPLGRGSANHGPSATAGLVCKWKFYWNTAVFVHLNAVSGYFHATATELNSDWNGMTHQPKRFIICTFAEKFADLFSRIPKGRCQRGSWICDYKKYVIKISKTLALIGKGDFLICKMGWCPVLRPPPFTGMLWPQVILSFATCWDCFLLKGKGTPPLMAHFSRNTARTPGVSV